MCRTKWHPNKRHGFCSNGQRYTVAADAAEQHQCVARADSKRQFRPDVPQGNSIFGGGIR